MQYHIAMTRRAWHDGAVIKQNTCVIRIKLYTFICLLCMCTDGGDLNNKLFSACHVVSTARLCVPSVIITMLVVTALVLYFDLEK